MLITYRYTAPRAIVMANAGRWVKIEQGDRVVVTGHNFGKYCKSCPHPCPGLATVIEPKVVGEVCLTPNQFTKWPFRTIMIERDDGSEEMFLNDSDFRKVIVEDDDYNTEPIVAKVFRKPRHIILDESSEAKPPIDLKKRPMRRIEL